MYLYLLYLLGITMFLSSCAVKTPGISNEPEIETESSITILYDNYAFSEHLKPDWGFSCLIVTPEKTILFDTGKKSEILLHNSKSLKINLYAIDQVVISHNHPDHTGGLDAVLQLNPSIPVYFPTSFPASFSESILRRNGLPVRVDKAVKIAEHVYLTGEMGDQTKEQSLILDTKKGLIVVTGCSHQGIVNILQLAKKMFNKDIILVIGGLHLQSYKNPKVEEIVEEFKNIGVKQCGASHCTGNTPLALFENAYGENFIPMGVGKVIHFSN